MTLQNLLRIGKLKEHAPTAAEVQRLLAAIERNLADAAVASISDETRFDVAYKAVMQCALVAMMPVGYRPATSESAWPKPRRCASCCWRVFQASTPTY